MSSFVDFLKRIFRISLNRENTGKHISVINFPHKHTQLRPEPRIFLAADLHLDHRNIIRFCHRPFRSVHQMNSALIRNWNRTVGRNDIVYFLGDLSAGRRSRPVDYWLRKLNGKIFFIQGNHDRWRRRIIKSHNKKYLIYNEVPFILVHSPWDAPKDWKGWIIHGHKHNNDTKRFPLINRRDKRVNVSCELTQYRPIPLAAIRRMIG